MPILNMNYGANKGGANIGEPTNISATTTSNSATITWTDNDLNTIPPATFFKSVLVRKVGSAPTSPSDGDLVVTETVKNTYSSNGYPDTGLTEGTTYYYQVFSYSDTGGITYGTPISVTPSSGGTGNIQGMTTSSSTSFSYQYTRGTRMSNDGTILLVGFEGSGKLVEYSLSTPFDLSTKSEVASLSVVNCQTGYFNDNGTILTVGGDKMYQYTVPTPYHITGAVGTYSKLIKSGRSHRQVFYANNGNTLFLSYDQLTEYTTGSPYNPTTLTEVYTLDTGSISIMGVAFNKDGNMYATCDLSGIVKQYSADTPFHISANDTLIRTETPGGQLLGIGYCDDFYKMVMCKATDNKAYVYSLPNS